MKEKEKLPIVVVDLSSVPFHPITLDAKMRTERWRHQCNCGFPILTRSEEETIQALAAHVLAVHQTPLVTLT